MSKTVRAYCFIFTALIACSGVVHAQTVTGFTQFRDGFFDGDYSMTFSDKVIVNTPPTAAITLTYETDVDEVDILLNDRVTQRVTINVPAGAWTLRADGRYETVVTGGDSFFKVQDFWTGDYDIGTISRAFNPANINAGSSGVIASVNNPLGTLEPIDNRFAGTTVIVTDRGDYDFDGFNLVEFGLPSTTFSALDGQIQSTEFDLLQLVYDNGTDPLVSVGFLSPEHTTFFNIDISDVFSTGVLFDLSDFQVIGLDVSGDRDDDSLAFDDEAGLVINSSSLVYSAIPEPSTYLLLAVGILIFSARAIGTKRAQLSKLIRN